MREERSSSILGKDEVPSSNLGSSSRKALASKDAGAFLADGNMIELGASSDILIKRGPQSATESQRLS